MGQLSALLDLARQRAEQRSAPYAGEVTPQEAWTLLQSAPGTVLIDVRSHAERQWVGRVPNSVEIEWASWPGMAHNDHFLVHMKKQVDPEAMVLFLCRSGVRSIAAAKLATENGWRNCYNILEGFEGEKDANGQRGHIGGWRKAGLPWTQS